MGALAGTPGLRQNRQALMAAVRLARAAASLIRSAREVSAVSIFCRVDDKHVPLYRVIWVSATPHFCGEPDCQCEGLYEVALEGGESVWATHDEQKKVLSMIEEWQDGERGF